MDQDRGRGVAAAVVVVVLVAGGLLLQVRLGQVDWITFGGEASVTTHDERVASRSVVVGAGVVMAVLLVLGAVTSRLREALAGAAVLVVVAAVLML